MAEKQKKKNETIEETPFKKVYMPTRDYNDLSELSKATEKKKSQILREGMWLFAENQLNKNSVYRKGKELIAEVDNNQKEVIKVLKQLLSRQVEHTEAIRSLYSDLENLRKEVSKNGKK